MFKVTNAKEQFKALLRTGILDKNANMLKV